MDYLRIAVCDDESIDLSKTIELLKSYDSEQQLTIITYMSANALLYSINRKTIFHYSSPCLSIRPIAHSDW